jgi:acetoin:2,6-dichlorophenolindophenol oxidoreductase subunit alpha
LSENHSKELLLALYRDMLRIRRVQLRLESLYHLDEMKTPIHLCIGQEAVAVGVCANLEKDDYVASNHRGHGHYLAKGGDLGRLIAELHCRETGCAGGRGGSMHLVDTGVGHMGSSSIVGGGIPIGTGFAFASSMRKQDRVSAIFFSDGAADEGVLYESINFAILKKLPAIFVYENNQFSVCSHVSARQTGDTIFHATPPDRMYTRMVDGNSVLEVYDAVKTAVGLARTGRGPAFIECRTYRMRGHAGAGSDAHLGYRSGDAIDEWEKKCPLFLFQNRLLEDGVLTERMVADMGAEIDQEIDGAFRFAEKSPLPVGRDLPLHLFAE